MAAAGTSHFRDPMMTGAAGPEVACLTAVRFSGFWHEGGEFRPSA